MHCIEPQLGSEMRRELKKEPVGGTESTEAPLTMTAPVLFQGLAQLHGPSTLMDKLPGSVLPARRFVYLNYLGVLGTIPTAGFFYVQNNLE